MKRSFVLCCALTITASAISQSAKPHSVPDEATAVAIAEAALIPVYGRKQIESERPFTASLKDDVWTVAGTLYCSDGRPQTYNNRPPSCFGGVAVVKISKLDGHIVSMTHYK